MIGVTDAIGPALFARFAWPANALGYCGPADSDELFGLAHEGHDVRALVALARAFEGAWPYLELIAAWNGRLDPLDPRVVEAYWIGNQLLDAVPRAAVLASLDERFRRRMNRAGWEQMVDTMLLVGVPHHNLHVFVVSPWIGLLRGGLVDQPLHVLDRCRIRRGIVERVDGDIAVVRSCAVVWNGEQVLAGPVRSETAMVAADGESLAGPIRAGDRVALHWDYICSRLDRRQWAALARVEGPTAVGVTAPRAIG